MAALCFRTAYVTWRISSLRWMLCSIDVGRFVHAYYTLYLLSTTCAFNIYCIIIKLKCFYCCMHYSNHCNISLRVKKVYHLLRIAFTMRNLWNASNLIIFDKFCRLLMQNLSIRTTMFRKWICICVINSYLQPFLLWVLQYSYEARLYFLFGNNFKSCITNSNNFTSHA